MLAHMTESYEAFLVGISKYAVEAACQASGEKQEICAGVCVGGGLEEDLGSD